ncbi:GNAT family N-acetyltransferase [Streptomyces sp. SBT349]|uniref:GNAT family N-acetyltransferase n=1 Tax=Streptomyces sp. SBT349 TaxID=1580539 RepID=UPI00066C980C|nr:GNAT family N-acetyltransferase [Streptomyces sp. SBT349]
MSPDALTVRARRVWEELAGVPVRFRPPSAAGPEVVVAPGSGFAPPAWTGVVTLGGATVVTVPTPAAAALLRRALATCPVASHTDAVAMAAALPVTAVLGPASLAYLDPGDFAPGSSGDGPADAATAPVERVDPGHPDLLRLLAEADPGDADESGLGEITSPAFAVREAATGALVAAAGYGAWPAATAHLCVLTARDLRGRGLARRAAAGAVAHALDADLLPQWRARPPASRRVARALGFRELGHQLSLELGPADGGSPRSVHG